MPAEEFGRHPGLSLGDKEEVRPVEEQLPYESPVLTEVGDFGDRTLGGDGLGWELDSYCYYLC